MAGVKGKGGQPGRSGGARTGAGRATTRAVAHEGSIIYLSHVGKNGEYTDYGHGLVSEVRRGNGGDRVLIIPQEDGELRVVIAENSMLKERIVLTKFIGAEYRSFERVGLAFRAAGYQAPKPDVENGEGAFVANIVDQYTADLSKDQIVALIGYALGNPVTYLEGMEPGELDVAGLA